MKGHNGDSGVGKVCQKCGKVHCYTVERKKKISEKNKGSNNGMYGKHSSIETRKKISQEHQGHTRDHNNGTPCKKCGGIHKSGHGSKGHNWDHHKGDVCRKCGKVHKSPDITKKPIGDKGHNFDHGVSDVCKACGKIHISGRLGKPPKIKGLTKETSEGLLRMSKKLTGRKHNYPCNFAIWREKNGVICTHPKFQFIPELGHGVRSSWEKEFGLMLKNAKISYSYESTPFKVLIGDKTHKYYPDFKIKENYFIETKGFVRPYNTSKINAFIEQYPNVKLVILGLDNTLENDKPECRIIPWTERATLVEEIKCNK